MIRESVDQDQPVDPLRASQGQSERDAGSHGTADKGCGRQAQAVHEAADAVNQILRTVADVWFIGKTGTDQIRRDHTELFRQGR